MKIIPIVVTLSFAAAISAAHSPAAAAAETGERAKHVRIDTAAEITQIAPTVLSLLGLPVDELKAVKIEHTAPLAGVR